MGEPIQPNIGVWDNPIRKFINNVLDKPIQSSIFAMRTLIKILSMKLPIITEPMYAPEEPEYITKPLKSFKSKHINMEKIISMDNLADLSVFELRIIMIILIQKGRKNKLEDAEDNQIVELSLRKNPKIFTTPTSYYSAIKRFTAIGLLEKLPGKNSLYRVNPSIISNLTHDQAIDIGIKKDFNNRIK